MTSKFSLPGSLLRTLFFSSLFLPIQTKVLTQVSTFPEIPPYVLPAAKMEYDDGQDPMDCRLFRTTTTRLQINLSGFWEFITDPENEGEDKGYAEQFPHPDTYQWVPGTWNATARYWQYQGPAWYNRTFDQPVDGHLRLHFGGVFYRTKVWLDGKLIGEHEGGYSPFNLTVPDLKKGDHILTVFVDNRLDDESLPKDGVDWFPYGGIFRPVYAELVPAVYIDHLHIIPEMVKQRTGDLNVKVFLKNFGGRPSEQTLRMVIDGQEIHSHSYSITGTDPMIEFKVVLRNPRVWSPQEPNLYSVGIILGEQEDNQFTRFGVRTLTADGNQVLLNGERIKLMGANHHDDHPDWGSALPPHIIQKDIEILKRMGANAVRGHYPPSEMFMDFCDQYGLFFMNEVPSWQYRPEQLAKQVVKDKIKQQYFEMVDRDMNHPCVFSWSLGNEWRDFEKSYDDIKELVDYARMVDRNHFITFITGGAHIDRSNALVDIICTNWSKYQWYWDQTVLDDDVGEESIARLNAIHEKFPDKPVVLTEFGGSGSQAGWHNWGNVKWSEEYQARNVWDSGYYGLEQDWISGGCVWQFCDTRTAHLRMLGPRLRGWNVKGVVDGYRQPKLAYYKLQELFHRFENE
ncbi:glycoside hydrolase family 2 protein [Candidatus Neomarinimicrobiota bacterium]